MLPVRTKAVPSKPFQRNPLRATPQKLVSYGMNAPTLGIDALAVRGRIEAVQFGAEFLVVDGWTAAADGSQPRGQISLRVAGMDHDITGLFARGDLQGQGISTQPVGFCVDLPVGTM